MQHTGPLLLWSTATCHLSNVPQLSVLCWDGPQLKYDRSENTLENGCVQLWQWWLVLHSISFPQLTWANLKEQFKTCYSLKSLRPSTECEPGQGLHKYKWARGNSKPSSFLRGKNIRLSISFVYFVVLKAWRSYFQEWGRINQLRCCTEVLGG